MGSCGGTACRRSHVLDCTGRVNVKSLPTATFSGASVTVTGGNFSGLGNVPAIATLTVTGEATFTCFNPQGHPNERVVEAYTPVRGYTFGRSGR
jgi:hypothetical protein